MKRIYLLFAALILFTQVSTAQKKAIKNESKKENPGTLNRPKLVVGLVIDQMRWDYLYRYYSRYTNGGFKRLINEGFSAENTFIPYTPTYTACGHASIYTGSVPSINGIIGNDWYDPQLQRSVYCAEDTTVKTVGSNTAAGLMSPKNMLVTTITDELRLATNFKSKVIGISLKDRGSILPAGHSANAAYWFDGQTGDWISSTYYMNQLPAWMQDYNKKKEADKFFAQNWNTLYPIDSYTQSTSDNKVYERKNRGEENPVFPHPLKLYMGKNYEMIKSTPYGNTITLDLAKQAIAAENLGQNNTTDFLAVSCSATDYVGHQYGPNSIEAEDTYLRLDKDLEAFFNYLDNKLGKGNYLFFLSADHGAAHVAGFMTENKLPGGTFSDANIIKTLNAQFEEKFKVKKAIITGMNSQIVFNHDAIKKANADYEQMKTMTIDYLKKQPGVMNAVDLSKLSSTTLPERLKMAVTNGYNARRSGDIYYFLQSGYFSGGSTGTTHGSWNPYDSHIPCVFMGWKVKAGKTNKTHYMTDISATLAAMLQIQMPSGCVGEPITELTHQ
ncbi:alkaline phosphatase PafA [Pedobacter heparinus]|uniref:Type I phosphodiesterase/nucleotide pyrophosphatase n=1 Tax=Pedobacter heparinus (strain ATCC 13125 / DSM 2366 / CIP 104194 / JCM 7457 / NBRC 12017 / NCIMB 9290 / NRRL B-14731 / HIM 762-3) TaxID=485917 RepID=C6Y3V4_PEDHD|nr:alkaline phosphatase PafA [Pedobacter heparinus]ACU03383.1 type I phosphodiesterase/nucleotide pyrophosphatase [Pedobacter heparinus DSM 2366]